MKHVDKETNTNTSYRNEADAMQALTYYCTLMETPDLELDAAGMKKVQKKAETTKQWAQKNVGKAKQAEIEGKLKEMKAECNPVVCDALQKLASKA